jgi:UDP-N-acetylglucosamine--dolichyl-phosphate N-acetylglucosaminephosphotransferase
LGLLKHNWFPANVFVGDTYCYFAGMTFAVVGILGHFSKTLLLFFIPQVINFLWSVPQIFKIVPCPRHRLPGIDASGKMIPSTFECNSNQHVWLKRIMRVDLKATQIPNMTVITLCLMVCGPMTEKQLCTTLLGLQMTSCCFGLFVRYYIAKFIFDE